MGFLNSAAANMLPKTRRHGVIQCWWPAYAASCNENPVVV